MDSIPQKQCAGPCQKILPATTEFFYADTRRKGGLQRICKMCDRVRCKVYRQAHKEEKRLYDKTRYQEYCAYYQAHTEERRVYRQSRIEIKRAYDKVYRRTHAEKKRAYHQAHREQQRAHNHKRRALKRGNGGTYTVADIQRQYKAQKGKCYYCQCKLDKMYHRDHIVPLSRGGSNNPENIVLTCPTCNFSKHDKLPHEWIEGGRLL